MLWNSTLEPLCGQLTSIPRRGSARLATLLLVGGLALAGCATTPTGAPSTGNADAEDPETRRFAILSVNDVYRIEGVDAGAFGGIPRLRTLRAELEQEHPDLLVFLAGDFLYPSLLSRVYEGAQMTDALNRLDGDANRFDDRFFVTFGNHEFDRGDLEDAPMLQDRIDESGFDWISSNIEFATGPDGSPLIQGPNLKDTILVDAGGVRVGIFGLTLDSEQPEYVRAIGPSWDVAENRSRALREAGAELVIGLTHLDMAVDSLILRSLGEDGPDLIVGGHEHQKQFEKVEGRWVVKADAEARTAAVIEVEVPRTGRPRLEVEFRELGLGVVEDPAVRKRVDYWLNRHDEAFCRQELAMDPGCLDDKIGVAQERLDAEELEIRMYETSLGNWLLDLALEAFRPYGAQVAFTNSGSLRLNQDVPPGVFTRRHLEELFQYPSGLKLMRLTGAQLQLAIEHSIDGWGFGNGYFLQIAGFAYRFDPTTGFAGDLTLLGPDGPRRILPDEEILAVTGDFLAHAGTGQDGYTMLPESSIVPLELDESIELRQLAIEAFEKAGDEGIAPRTEGRICNELFEKRPCLALIDSAPSSP